MKTPALSLLLFFTFLGFSHGQDNTPAIDSLKNIIKATPTDSVKADLLAKFCSDLCYSDVENAINFGKNGLQLSKQINYKPGELKALVYLTSAEGILKGDYDLGIEYLKKAEEIALDLDDKNWLLKVYNGFGVIYNYKGFTPKALEYYILALKTRDQVFPPPTNSKPMGNLALLYQDLEQYDKALDFMYKSLEINQTNKNQEGIATDLVNLGNIYIKLQNYDTAFYFIKKAQPIFKGLNDLQGLSIAYGNGGDILHKKGKYKEALEMYYSANKLDKQLGDTYGLIYSYRGISKNYKGLLQFNKAIKNGLKSLELAESSGIKEEIKESSLNLYEIYKQQGDFNKALKYHEVFSTFQDSINSESKLKEISILEDNYELEKAEKENELLREKEAKNQTVITLNKTIISALGVVITLLIVLVGIYWKSNSIKKENNRKLQELNEEQDSFMGVVAHDLKSPLNKISGLSQLLALSGDLNYDQKQYIKIINEVIEDGKNLISSLLEIHELENSKNKLKPTRFELGQFVREVAKTYESAAAKKNITIICNNLTPEIYIHTDKSSLTRILDNLISNALKFSFNETSVFLQIHSNENNVKISVKDEGPGIKKEEQKLLFRKFQKLSTKPTDGENSSGLGLAITKSLIHQLQGDILVKSEVNNGTEFIVKLPK
ncbi:tetratricopeptide repeat-containing sensor histidine kinase [Flexithrix dorotheae]|uniref:tetratricopeptide repeat-containing sensor histidine kinase n=1 Tax=Flexithrix dorotheae TaxID=70993 RepID=UPI00037540F0|nr:tetratricopeptide repeat protein [Flexithrix dorotheae]